VSVFRRHIDYVFDHQENRSNLLKDELSFQALRALQMLIRLADTVTVNLKLLLHGTDELIDDHEEERSRRTPRCILTRLYLHKVQNHHAVDVFSHIVHRLSLLVYVNQEFGRSKPHSCH